MSISSIGTSSITASFQPSSGPGKEIREGMKQLQEALKSGDLDAAQSAYDSLTQALEDDSASGLQDARKTKLIDTLSKVGEALETGDLDAAKQAMDAGRPEGPPPGGMQGPPPPSEDAMNAMGGLADALNSGSLSDAQSAYTSLTDLLSQEDTEDEGKQNFLSALSDVGTALSSGNLASAQKLFAALTPRGSGVNTFA